MTGVVAPSLLKLKTGYEHRNTRPSELRTKLARRRCKELHLRISNERGRECRTDLARERNQLTQPQKVEYQHRGRIPTTLSSSQSRLELA